MNLTRRHDPATAELSASSAVTPARARVTASPRVGREAAGTPSNSMMIHVPPGARWGVSDEAVKREQVQLWYPHRVRCMSGARLFIG